MVFYDLKSPDGTLNIHVEVDGAVSYSVSKNNTELIGKSPIAAVLEGADLRDGLRTVSEERGEINETYSLPAYKKAECINHCNTLTLHLAKGDYPYTLEFRAFDDGAAFRQIFEKADILKQEISGFGLPASTRRAYCMKFRFSYEDEYNPVPLEDLYQNFWAFPILIEGEKGVWGLLTEAAVYGDYGGSMVSSDKKSPAMLRVTAPPDEFTPQKTPVNTPWRVIMAGSLDDIVETSILENLNPASEIEDTSFIKPGMVSWSWMTENNSPMDFYRQRDYIDFAAKMHWPYCLDDGGWKEAKVNIPALCDYGRSKGVGIWIWEHRRNLQDPEVADRTLKLWKSWGVAGVKIDFFESDTRERIATMDMLAKTCAKYQLMCNFHGCTKPSGEIRRWPNLLSREGVMGGENFQNYSTEYYVAPTARHNCTLPFTRNAVGPMDYTPVTYGTYRTGTTDTHQTALPVIFTSYVTHIGESPEIFFQHPCGKFLEGLPTGWDETHLLEGAPACYVTMARRKGTDWYVAGICASRGRTAEVNLDFLDDGQYQATLYQDSLDDLRYVDVPIGSKEPTTKEQYDEWEKITSRPTSHHHNLHTCRISDFTADRTMHLEIPCVQDGGFAMKIQRI